MRDVDVERASGVISESGASPVGLSVDAVARHLGVHPSTVYSLVASGKLPHYRIGLGRGTIRVSRAQLESYLASVAVGVPAVADGPGTPRPVVRTKHVAGPSGGVPGALDASAWGAGGA